MDNEKKIDPALPEEELEYTEDAAEVSEEEMEYADAGVVIEHFDEEKEEDDELYERYIELMNQEDDEDDIAAVAERITGERHSRVTTAAPLRVRVPSASAPTADPAEEEIPAAAPVPMYGQTQEFPVQMSGEAQPEVSPAGRPSKKSYAGVAAAVLALLIVLSAVVITVSVLNRDEPEVPVIEESLPVTEPVPDEPEELPEETEPAENEPEIKEEAEETVMDDPEPIPEEEVVPDVPAEEPEPEPVVEPEPVIPTYNVTLDFYDRDDITATVTQMTLAEVYTAVGYTPRESDRPSVGMDYVISADSYITIAAAEYKNVSVKETVPYGTEEIKVDTIPRGEKRYISYGETGEVTKTYTVEYINGKETARTLAYEETTKWAVNEKYEIGVGGSFTNANGVTYTYSYRRTVPATYYNLEGLTYLGQMADESVIAVDPNNIPLGTKLYVKNDTYDFGIRVAADTGPKVDEWQIDIWLSPYNPQYASFAQTGYHNDMEIYYLD